MSEYPEHNKLVENKEAWEVVNDFIAFIEYNAVDRYGNCIDIVVVLDPEDESVPLSDVDKARLIADFFDINYDAFLAEKDQMLEDLRKMNKNLRERIET